LEEAVEPVAHLYGGVLELVGRVRRGRVTEVAEVEALRAFEQLVCGDRLVGVEGEVTATLEHEGRYSHPPEAGPGRARREISTDRRDIALRPRVPRARRRV